MIEGATRILGAAQGFIGLPVRDERLEVALNGGGVHTFAAMVTAWEPTPAELEALNAGAFVEIIIVGSSHPPIKVEVGKHQRGKLAPGEGWTP